MTSPGWYPDPTNRFEFRYFDGNEWSSSVSRAGREFLDPAPSGLAAPGTTWQPQAPWQPQGPWQPGSPVPQQEGNGLAVTSLVLGVLACVFGLIPFMFVLVFLLAFLAIIFGAIGASRRSDGTRSKMAIAGLVLGLVGVVAGVIGVMIVKVWVEETTDSLNEVFSTITFEETTATTDADTETTEFVAQGLPASQPVTVTGEPLVPYAPGGADPAVGTLAPTLQGLDFRGETVNVTPQDGPYMLVFLAHWCPHCNAEIPVLIDWRNSGDVPTELNVIGVATAVAEGGENYPPSRWFSDKGWPWPVLVDESQGEGAAGKAAEAFGASGWPYFVIVGADGLVKARVSGQIETAELQSIVDAALAG